ncbi:hypothetical protein CLAFUW4_08384 [Fulvia fulva]|uniref:Uncharacterized protein n=1 Tax=Passalora fulva TaxID=5499 RepID=A0A9Q8LDU6_PASFU|nr:uncharacterized protein CLAFUR5_08489 [Fulvia fulva]KAK4628944.1 hypothetical protein CLAFUR4_08389 [Fulvia fulva]KAK4630706.1 hypothetical protein CLAFUR0_08384 [Fulvia fulva]UJO15665.1 hypothetical protein CLAFUR5_08489 [Fulvia fulva]WPV12323.1 hypothetical protein CLAFUW4_08384 [Fulvia fulva]WPV27513.1 hypothetical protein CLAFUW7_08384 [Fulvia fulva]
MACPPEITVHNFNASFDMNKKEGDDTSGMLKMQGLPWLVRQAASYSAVSINLKQFKDERGVEHLDQEQVSTGGVKQLEPRLLNGEWGERDVQFWGLVKGQNKYIKISEINDEFLKQDWLVEGDGEVIWSYTESLKNGWDATQIWGFATINGVRKHVRRIVSKKGKEEHKIRTVYDHRTTPAA